MKVNIVQYSGLGSVQGDKAPLGGGKIAGETRTSDGDFTGLNNDAEMIRVATDTTVYFKRDKAGAVAGSTDHLLIANSVEFFSVNGGETPTVTQVA